MRLTPSSADKNTTWQTALASAITDPEELLMQLGLDRSLLPAAKKAAACFGLKVPRGFVARMQKNNLKDPLLMQVLPIHSELEQVDGYISDPLEEAKANPIPGLLHKYHGRVLLTLVGGCAINCRFCFRRHFPYAENNPGQAGWEKALAYIAADPTIKEVIFSGGDPLIAPDKVLQAFTDKLTSINHVKILRIHTRIPIVLPERITPAFLQWIGNLKQKPVVIIHCNHPQEIDATVKNALKALANANVALFNQSVLLKGINDNVDTLTALSESLFEAGVQPYYLHLPDKVAGTAHFDLDRKTGQKLHYLLASRLSGYLVPKLVYEEPGAPAKVTLTL